jgi:hypothetical protein
VKHCTTLFQGNVALEETVDDLEIARPDEHYCRTERSFTVRYAHVFQASQDTREQRDHTTLTDISLVRINHATIFEACANNCGVILPDEKDG